MVRVDARRLLRALLLGGLVFLLVGGGTGLAMAAVERAQPAAMAFPRPGATATYSIKEFHVGEARGSADLDGLRLTWMPEVWIADTDFQLRLTHPLRTELFAGGRVYLRDAYYDAATGEPVLSSAQGPYTVDVEGLDCGDGASCEFRYDLYKTRGGLCAVRNALQDGQSLDQPLRITGYCDYLDGDETLTYHYVGEERVGRRDAHLFRDPDRPELRAWFSEDVAFPVRVTAALSNLVASEWLGHERMYDLRLTEVTPGEGQYTRPRMPLTEAGPGPIPLAARTAHLFDFTGHPFPLPFPRAYEAAAQDTSEHGLAGFLADHPDAYVAESYSQEHVDANGATHAAWYFVVTDGDAWKSVSVRQGPTKTWIFGMPLQTPPGVADGLFVEPWTLGDDAEDLRDAGGYYPPPSLLPERLPRPVDVLARWAFVQADPIQDARYFGWSLGCETAACLRPTSWIAAGFQARSEGAQTLPFMGEAGGSGDVAILSVDADGQPTSRWAFRYDRPQYDPLGTATPGKDYEMAPAAVHRDAGTWVLPGEEAVASLSFLAVLTSLLYYFWPTLKGLPALAGFSRIEDGAVLDHPTRRRVHDAITAEPGIHFQALARKAGVGRGTLDHHLRKLLDADLVVLRRSAGYTCYFAKGQVDRHLADAAPALRSDGSRAILQAVASNPGASSRDLAAHLGIAPSTVSYHLKRLEGAGLVAPGAKAGVRLTPLGQQASAA